MNAKELRAMHPLYRRLSGEVLWLFLEEQGLGPEECDSLMQHFLQEMEDNLRVMQKLLAHPERFLFLQLPHEHAARACPECAALHGMLLPATRPDWLNFMPPFGIGCPLKASALSPQAAEQAKIQEKAKRETGHKAGHKAGHKIGHKMGHKIEQATEPEAEQERKTKGEQKTAQAPPPGEPLPPPQKAEPCCAAFFAGLSCKTL